MMDCMAEERLVRLALQGTAARLDFDLGKRRVSVLHEETPERLLQLLQPLNLGVRMEATEAKEGGLPPGPPEGGSERNALMVLLVINATMFLIEMVAGVVYQSTGLIADSLDMLADAAVYAISLYAVGKALTSQARAARFSGYVQFLLAVGVLVEVARRVVVGSEPQGAVMMWIATIALVANVGGMVMIAKHRRGGLHMQASWIFTSTDVLANIGVIVAGVLVAWTESPWPDLLIGSAIGVLVLLSAFKILRLVGGSIPQEENRC